MKIFTIFIHAKILKTRISLKTFRVYLITLRLTIHFGWRFVGPDILRWSVIRWMVCIPIGTWSQSEQKSKVGYTVLMDYDWVGIYICAAKSSVSRIETSMRCGVFTCVSVINCSHHRFVCEAFDVHVIICLCFILCVADIKKKISSYAQW